LVLKGILEKKLSAGPGGSGKKQQPPRKIFEKLVNKNAKIPQNRGHPYQFFSRKP
jgi:hypothetical protein